MVEADEAGLDRPATIEANEALEIVADESAVALSPVTNEPSQVTSTETEPFTATIGLDRFSSYRMNFSGEFDGIRQGQPASGSLEGFLDVTKNPKAQHLWIEVDGKSLNSLAPLGLNVTDK